MLAHSDDDTGGVAAHVRLGSEQVLGSELQDGGDILEGFGACLVAGREALGLAGVDGGGGVGARDGVGGRVGGVVAGAEGPADECGDVVGPVV